MSDRSQDLEHLQLLSIFHYVVGGLAGLFALLPLLHLAIGLGMVTGAMGSEATAIGWIFVVFPAVFIALGLALAVSLVIAGRHLGRRQHYNYCLVIAAVACVFIPFGTVLGVFTLIVLTRGSVKELFGAGPPG